MGKRILYLECASGISGDMFVAAMLDLGADWEVLERTLKSMPLAGFQVRNSRVKKSGLSACDFAVIQDGEEKPHRGLAEILPIIEGADMTARARELAERIFCILAEAEAKAHGISPDRVHFHEVGALDSIVDIVSAAVCLDNLGVADVAVPSLSEGYGTVQCRHGILPVPVPAVVNIAAAHGLVLRPVDVEGELVTPTGAAIAAVVKTRDALPGRYRILRTGLGAGKRSYERPSLLRIMLLQDLTEETEGDTVMKLEAGIDDCSGEVLGYVMEQLFAAGARDVHYIPIYMKKNRPSWQLNVICREEDREVLEDILFRETTTIGIRRIRMERNVMEREQVTFPSSMGAVEMKVCRRGDVARAYPEYESLRKICRETGMAYTEAYQRTLMEWENR